MHCIIHNQITCFFREFFFHGYTLFKFFFLSLVFALYFNNNEYLLPQLNSFNKTKKMLCLKAPSIASCFNGQLCITNDMKNTMNIMLKIFTTWPDSVPKYIKQCLIFPVYINFFSCTFLHIYRVIVCFYTSDFTESENQIWIRIWIQCYH